MGLIISFHRFLPKIWPTALVWAITLGSVSLTLTSCSQLAQMGIGVTPIKSVIRDPAQYSEVTVRGKVVNQVGIFGQGAYELEDDTGSLWVFTKTGMPPLNSTLAVKGKATEGLTISGQNLGVTLTEQERL